MAFNFSSDGIQWSNSGGGGGGGTVTPDGEQTLTNKTLNADDNHILNLRKSNFADGVVRTSVRSEEEATDINLVTERAVALAVATYIFEQGIASDTWVVTHNLHKYPAVTIEDSAGTQFLAQVHYDSANQLTIRMNGATTGKVYLN